MNRQIRTDEELRKASEHLHYEFWMLMSLANALASGIASEGWLTNTLLESFIIHLRALLDFFYGERPKPDDVIAADYFSQGQWDSIKPPLSDALKKARSRAHKEVAHLTYERLNVTLETKPWAFLSLASEVQGTMNLFLKNVSKDRLADRWQSTGGQ
jgi:hypothetical protein